MPLPHLWMPPDRPDNAWIVQRISAVGFADTGGILAASLVASFVEPRLCASQVARGRLYCRQLD